MVIDRETALGQRCRAATLGELLVKFHRFRPLAAASLHRDDRRALVRAASKVAP